MSKYLKPALITTIILGVFVLILYGNIWLQEHSIRTASSIDPCTFIDRYNIACLKQPFGGMGAFNMYISASIIVFISLFLFKSSKHDPTLIPVIAISYIILSESIIQIFNVPILYSAIVLGGYTVGHTLYLLNGPTAIAATIITIAVSYMAGAFAIILKKFLYKSPH